MMRSLVVAFGLVTALAVAGTMTPKGQAMLGLNHPAAEQAAPVTVIQDKPAPVPAPVQSIAPTPASPVTRPAVVHPVAHPAPATTPRSQARPVGPVSQGPPVGQSVPQQGGPGGLASVANILLNLPQVLNQAHVGPAPSSDAGSVSSPSDANPARFHKKNHDDNHSRDAGDTNH